MKIRDFILEAIVILGLLISNFFGYLRNSKIDKNQKFEKIMNSDYSNIVGIIAQKSGIGDNREIQS